MRYQTGGCFLDPKVAREVPRHGGVEGDPGVDPYVTEKPIEEGDRAASGGSRGLLLPLARLLRSGNQSVVGVLVSCRGAENMHIKHHGSIFI